MHVQNVEDKSPGSTFLAKSLEAFGLVEIAIVLIIIGVLASIGMKGYKLIESAKAKALYQQIEDVRISAHMFKEKYHAWPGDYAQAQSAIHTDCLNGNGNGLIEGRNAEAQAEAGQFWTHLTLAELTNGLEVRQPGEQLVPSKHLLSGQMGGFLTLIQSFQKDMGPWVCLSQVDPSGSIKPCLTSKQASHIDQLFDDGDPLSGDIRASGEGESVGECLKESRYNFDSKSQACVVYFKLSY
jgi:Tfp pilus assembly protein PilE